MSYGFIYFASNDAMPGLTKIGHCTRHPMERIKELSSSTSCPQKFELLGFFGHPDCEFAERQIHSDFAEFRVNDRREFFQLSFTQLQSIARGWGDPHADAFVVCRLDRLVQEAGVRAA